MPGIASPTTNCAPVAVLLVMLPSPGEVRGTLPSAFVAADQALLQRRIGAAVQVLLVDETTSPAVIRSFAPAQLPSCVLVYRGVEVWRQLGLPTADQVVFALHETVRKLKL